MAAHRSTLVMVAAASTSSAISLIIVMVPLAYSGFQGLASAVASDRFLRATLLSISTAAVAATLSLILSMPAAYVAARSGGLAARLLSSLHLLLIGLPPVGIGISLLILFSRTPLVSELAAELGGLLFTPRAIVVAQTVITLPLALSVMTSTFTYIPRSLEEIAGLYGAGRTTIFKEVLLPLSAPGMAAAWSLSFFRALGEFGATLVLAGNIPGYTETLPIAMYNMLAIAEVEIAAGLMSLSTLIGLIAVYVTSVMQARMSSITAGIE